MQILKDSLEKVLISKLFISFIEFKNMSRFVKWENVHDSDPTSLTIFPAYNEPVPVQAEEAFDRLLKLIR